MPPSLRSDSGAPCRTLLRGDRESGRHPASVPRGSATGWVPPGPGPGWRRSVSAARQCWHSGQSARRQGVAPRRSGRGRDIRRRWPARTGRPRAPHRGRCRVLRPEWRRLRDVRHCRVLAQQRGRVDSDAVHAAGEPEPQDVLEFAADIEAVPVEVRLLRREQVQVPLAWCAVRLGNPGPRGPAEDRLPVVWGAVAPSDPRPGRNQNLDRSAKPGPAASAAVDHRCSIEQRLGTTSMMIRMPCEWAVALGAAGHPGKRPPRYPTSEGTGGRPGQVRGTSPARSAVGSGPPSLNSARMSPMLISWSPPGKQERSTQQHSHKRARPPGHNPACH